MKKSFLWFLMVTLLSLGRILPWVALAAAFALAASWVFFPSAAGTLLLLLASIVLTLVLIETWREPLYGVHRAGGQWFRWYRELS